MPDWLCKNDDVSVDIQPLIKLLNISVLYSSHEYFCDIERLGTVLWNLVYILTYRFQVNSFVNCLVKYISVWPVEKSSLPLTLSMLGAHMNIQIYRIIKWNTRIYLSQQKVCSVEPLLPLHTLSHTSDIYTFEN